MEGLQAGDGAQPEWCKRKRETTGLALGTAGVAEDFCDPSNPINCRRVGDGSQGGAGTAESSCGIPALHKPKGSRHPASSPGREPQPDQARHDRKKMSNSRDTPHLERTPFLVTTFFYCRNTLNCEIELRGSYCS